MPPDLQALVAEEVDADPEQIYLQQGLQESLISSSLLLTTGPTCCSRPTHRALRNASAITMATALQPSARRI